MAKKKSQTTAVVKIETRLKPYIAPKDAREAALLTRHYRINSEEEATQASGALLWIKQRVSAIKGNPRLLRLITKSKAALDAAKANHAEVKSIETDACAPFLAHDAPIRNELARFQTMAERARLAAQPKLTQKLTKRLTEAAQPMEVQVGDDTFEFEPDFEPGTAVATLQPIDTGETGMRQYWHWALVDPAKPFDKAGAPIPNNEAGLLALAKAVAAGEASVKLLAVNVDEAQILADSLNERLAVPGLVAYFEMRPVLNRSRR